MHFITESLKIIVLCFHHKSSRFYKNCRRWNYASFSLKIIRIYFTVCKFTVIIRHLYKKVNIGNLFISNLLDNYRITYKLIDRLISLPFLILFLWVRYKKKYNNLLLRLKTNFNIWKKYVRPILKFCAYPSFKLLMAFQFLAIKPGKRIFNWKK